MKTIKSGIDTSLRKSLSSLRLAVKLGTSLQQLGVLMNMLPTMKDAVVIHVLRVYCTTKLTSEGGATALHLPTN